MPLELSIIFGLKKSNIFYELYPDLRPCLMKLNLNQCFYQIFVERFQCKLQIFVLAINKEKLSIDVRYTQEISRGA